MTQCNKRRGGYGFLIAASLLAVSLSNQVAAGPLEDLKPGHWYTAGTNTLEDVSPQPYDSRIRKLISAWNGATYDTKREHLVVWGGGHADYWGNEVYVFDVETFTWLRLNDPYFPARDLDAVDTVSTYPDGSPASRHTYDSLVYLPEQDEMFFMGGSRWKNGNGDRLTGTFDLETQKWQYGDPFFAGVVNGASAYDASTGRVLFYGTQRFGEYDPTNGQWRSLRQEPMSAPRVAEFDPINRKFLLLGRDNNNPNRDAMIFDLSGDEVNFTRHNLNAEGTPYKVHNGFGLAYDPAIKKIVAWNGGADVYTLDLAESSPTWARITPAAGNSVIPTPGTKWGTYGRWRYIPSKGVFIGVNAADESVYFYRLDTGLNLTVPSVPAEETLDVL